jgi:exonuclease VII small subunit
VIAFAERSTRLKRQFLELLEKDLEFRRAILGMLELEKISEGLKRHDEKFEEILKSLDRHEAQLVKLREDMNAGFRRHDEELAKLREDMNKLREDMILGFKRQDEILERHAQELTKLREDMIAGFKRHDEILERHAQEIAKLREDFNKMLSVIAQIQEEQRRLREGYERLEKGVASLEKRVGSLEEGQIRLEKRMESLEEGQVRLEKRMDSLERGLKSLEGGMLKGFAEMSKFAGVTFEEFVRGFLTEALRSSGEIPEGVELRRAVVDGEEINIFLEDPLIVGEVTAYVDSVGEIMKLLRKAELVKSKYSREPKKIMIVLTAKKNVAKEMEKIAEERGVKLVIGKVVD